MPYLNDRQRVEIGLFPQIFIAVTFSGVTNRQDPDYQETMGYLLEAAKEAVGDLPARKQRQLLSRVERVHKAILAPHIKEAREMNATGYKIGLIAYFALRSILDCDYLVLAPGSAMDKGLARVLEALEPDPDEARLVASARKQGRRLLLALQAEGLFPGVPFLEDEPVQAAA